MKAEIQCLHPSQTLTLVVPAKFFFWCKLDKIILCDVLLPFKVSVLVSIFFWLISNAHLVFSCFRISYSCSHLLFSIESGADLVHLFFGPREPTIADLMFLCCVGIFFGRGFPEPGLSERAPVRFTFLRVAVRVGKCVRSVMKKIVPMVCLITGK